MGDAVNVSRTGGALRLVVVVVPAGREVLVAARVVEVDARVVEVAGPVVVWACAVQLHAMAMTTPNSAPRTT